MMSCHMVPRKVSEDSSFEIEYHKIVTTEFPRNIQNYWIRQTPELDRHHICYQMGGGSGMPYPSIFNQAEILWSFKARVILELSNKQLSNCHRIHEPMPFYVAK